MFSIYICKTEMFACCLSSISEKIAGPIRLKFETKG